MDICEIYINAEFNFQRISVMSIIQLTDILAQFNRQLWKTCLFMTWVFQSTTRIFVWQIISNQRFVNDKPSTLNTAFCLNKIASLKPRDWLYICQWEGSTSDSLSGYIQQPLNHRKLEVSRSSFHNVSFKWYNFYPKMIALNQSLLSSL